MTVWALSARFAAANPGIAVDPSALKGGLQWIEDSTQDEHSGYDAPGRASSRTPSNMDYSRDLGQAMTAAGLWARLLAGYSMEWEGMKNSVDLLQAPPPLWRTNELANDMQTGFMERWPCTRWVASPGSRGIWRSGTRL